MVILLNSNSKLILGCKHCEQEIKETKGFSFGQNGDLQLPFAIRTEFEDKDLMELFTNHYYCPFCEGKLEITPRMMKCVTTIFEKNFHVDVLEQYFEISNGELSFSVPSEKEITSVYGYLAQSGVILENADEYLPTREDLELIQSAIREFDTTKWIFRIESGKAHTPFISATGLWFNGI